MDIISITTTQNINIEYELANLGERIVAAILDLLILSGYLILIIFLFSTTHLNDSVWLTILLYLPLTFYSLWNEIFFNGQSVGKRAMNMRVISLNGSHVTFSQYLIRWLFRLIDVWLFSFLPGIVAIAVSKKNQRIGDMVAGTTLIKTRSRIGFQQTLFTPTIDAQYKVTYPEVVNLSDADMQLIKEVLIAVNKSGNTMLAYEAMQKIQNILQIKSQTEPLNFLYTTLADYNFLASKL